VPFEWIFDGVGGGVVGVLAVMSVVLAVALFRERAFRLSERDQRITELRTDLKEQIEINKEHVRASNRTADVLETWMPASQIETVRRRLPRPDA